MPSSECYYILVSPIVVSGMLAGLGQLLLSSKLCHGQPVWLIVADEAETGISSRMPLLLRS